MTVNEHSNDEPFRPLRETLSPAAQRLDNHLATAIADLTPQEAPMPAPSPTGFQQGEISGLFQSLRARKDAMVAGIKANAAEVDAVLTVGEQMSAGLKADADAMKAELGQLTNFPPA